ncbi:glycosyltransferase [Candidatus Sumerlaeota bacterium]|nr:glycosyltransferase [Candidatus Sumerlaeota bacterium]
MDLQTELPRVLHLTSSAHIGGTERMLLRFLEKCDRSKFLHVVATMQPAGPLLDACRKIEIETLGLASQNPLNPESRGQLRALLDTQPCAIVHAYGLRADVLSRGIARRARVAAFVSAIRSPDPWRRRRHVWLDRWTARGGRVGLFISNSEAGRQSRIEREGFAPDKIVTIHNGIDPPDLDTSFDASAARAQLGLEQRDRPVVAMIANLRRMKGHLDAIVALKLLRANHPDIRIVFAGRDDSDGLVREAAVAAGVEDRIVFCGFLADPLPLMRLADIYCMASHWEGCPASLLEAMALERPIVATRVGGIPELVRHEQEALLVAPGDPVALAEALKVLIDDRDRATRLARGARRRAMEHFTLRHMVERIEAAYVELLESKGNRGT